MIVANVVCKDNIPNVSEDYTELLEVSNKLDVTPDPTKPTIIIGWKHAKVNKGFSLTRKKISSNLYWTFKPQEKRSEFEVDIKDFIQRAHNQYIQGIQYKVLDPIIHKITTIKSITDNIQGCTTYLHLDRMLYIYDKRVIYGLDLDICEFAGFKKQSIISAIRKVSGTFVEEESIYERYKTFHKYIRNGVKYIPYLIYKDGKTK